MSGAGWTPRQVDLNRIAEEIPLRVLEAIESIEDETLRPGQRPRLLRRVVEAVWGQSPAPAMARALEVQEALRDHEKREPLNGGAAHLVWERECEEARALADRLRASALRSARGGGE